MAPMYIPTGEVTSKVVVVLSINRQFWLVYEGSPTLYGILTYVNMPELPTYTHDDCDFRCYLARINYMVDYMII